MNGKTYINGDELTALANSLKSKGENLLNAYKGDCSQAIEMSADCLQLSGLSTTDFFQALEKIYTQVNERIASLSDFLTNVVVAEYNAVSEAITNSFNVEFANEISSLLGITVHASIGPVTSPAIPGRPIPYQPAPGSGSLIPGKPKDDVIELDPREKEGFEPKDPIKLTEKEDEIKPIKSSEQGPIPDAEITPVRPNLPERDAEVKAVALDDNGVIEANTGVKPLKPEVANTPAPAPEVTPIDRNRDVKAVALDDNGVIESKPNASVSIVKPDLPPVQGTTSTRPGDRSVSAVYLDDNGKTVSAGGPIKPSVSTPSTTSTSATITKPTVKPDLPPLPTKTSGTGSSSISFGTAYPGGGGGASMAEVIAFDSMANPLRKLK